MPEQQAMSSAPALPAPSPARYAALGLPLAMIALPVYIQTPKLYGDTLGLDLGLLGLLLLLTRAFDTVQDPWLGRLSDRFSHGRGYWRWGAALLLAVSLLLLFNPPDAGATVLALWLGVTLVLVYSSYSLLQIDYLAWGGSLARSPAELARFSGAREAAAVVGVILASSLPSLLALQFDVLTAYALFSVLMVAILAGGAGVSLSAGRRAPAGSGSSGPVWHCQPFRQLALIWLINCMANALPATLVLFFIDDVLRLERWSGLFLLLYFGAALAGLPLWLAAGRRWGLRRSWQFSLVSATLAFCGALLLGAGDGWAYGLICVLAGLSLGADLALPPALLAHTLEQAGIGDTGPFYGWWTLLSKASLALAAGLALPLLDMQGYQPGQASGSGLLWLSLLYAGLPCLIKLLTALLLWRRLPA